MLKALLDRLARRDEDNAAALIAAGNRAEAGGRLGEACALYREAIAAAPTHARAHLNLGAALEASGDMRAAEQAYRAVLEFDAENAYANYNIANLIIARGDSERGIRLLRDVLRVKPDFPEAHVALSNLLDVAGHAEEALQHLSAAIRQRPEYSGAWYNYGLVLRRLERIDAAEDALRKAIELDPAFLHAYAALAALLRGEARSDEALQIYSAVRRQAPEALRLNSGELFTLLFTEDVSEGELFERHREFGQHIEALHPLPPVLPRKGEQRRLKLGYLSSDLYRHPVALFLLPVLENHDRSAFEVHCYATNSMRDEVTAELRNAVDAWHEAGDMSDAQLAQRVRDDAIDILLDLTGHAGELRLGVFAQHPAPVQASWLGYLHTSGLRRIGYRVTDRHTDPPGMSERLHTETLLRLPDSQWCYRPFIEVSVMSTPPCESNGFVTFGSFNHFSKLSRTTRARWRALLSSLPAARLVVVGCRSGRAKDRLLTDLCSAGVPETRIEILSRVSLQEYFALFNRVDIALDTSPYSGGTTTCDALWMGVPVLTAPGSRSVSRSAASLLSTVGLGDWIAATPDRYVSLALEKAGDVAGLATLRRTLRDRMRASPLMDERRFTRNLEEVYRFMWKDHARLV